MTNQPSSTNNQAQEKTGQISPQVPPPPGGASDVLREAIASDPASVLERQKAFGIVPQNNAEWLAFIAADDEAKAKEVQAVIDEAAVSVERDEIEGVAVHQHLNRLLHLGVVANRTGRDGIGLFLARQEPNDRLC